MRKDLAVSILITAHNESHLLQKSVVSVYQNIDFSTNQHANHIEVYLNLDTSDFKTKKAALSLKSKYPSLNLTYSNHNDVSIVRNLFASNFQDSFLFFLDGDDYWDNDWIYRFLKLKNKSKSTIYHPNFTLFYNDKDLKVLRSKLHFNKTCTISQMMIENIFSSSFICHSSIFGNYIFKTGSTDSQNKYAYEDWSFFRDTMANGIRHKLILNTTHFHYIRNNSNTTKSLLSNQIPHPFDLSSFSN